MTDPVPPAEADTLADAAVRAATTAQSDALAAHPVADTLLALLRDMRTVLLADNPAAVRRSVGWFGRLLGNDIELTAEAEQLQQQAGVLAQRAHEALRQSHSDLEQLKHHLARLQQVQQQLQQAREALLQAADAASGDLPKQRLTARAHHLQQLLATTDLSTRQLQLSLDTHAQLHARFGKMADNLLPLLTQSALIDTARHAAPAYRQALGDLDALEGLITTDSTQEPP